MATTSLKLSDELKLRATAMAQRQGISPHAFMVGAIEHAAAAAEQRASFVADAVNARKQMQESGKGFDADEVHTYLMARANGQKVIKPKAKSWQS
jgi:predicted transcriptional regulator